jgi:lipopolysaccharide exporter
MVHVLDKLIRTLGDKNDKKELSNTFASDVVVLISGTTIAQIISIISAPIITRLYGAEAYGLAALFSSIVSVIAVIACFRYELSIMLPKTDEEASNLFALSLMIVIAVSVVLVPIIWLMGDNLAILLNSPAIEPYLWLVPPMVFFTGSFSAINYWNSRKRKFGRLSTAQVAKSATTSGIQLGLGFSGYAYGGGLIGAGIVGQAVATLTLGYQAWKSDMKSLQASIRWDKMKAGIKRYHDFPRYDIWSALLSTLSWQLPIFMLSIFFTSTIVGYYSLGLIVLQLPMTFIGSAIGQVFFQRASVAKHKSDSEFASVVGETAKKLILIGFPAILAVTFFGSDIFTVVFGASWAEAGTYAEILSFWTLVAFVTSPLSNLFNILNKLRFVLFLNIALIFIRACSLFIGGIFNDVHLGLILFSLTSGLIYLAVGRWILIESGVSLSDLFRSTSKYLVIAASSLAVTAAISYLFVNDSLVAVMLGLASVVPYYLILVSHDNEMKTLLTHLFRRSGSH